MITIKSFRDIVKLYYIYQKEAQLAFITTLVLILLAAFFLPARYHSEARLLVKPGRENTTLPIEFGDRQTFVSPSTQRDPIIDEELQITGSSIVSHVAKFYIEQTASQAPVGLLQKIRFQIKTFVSYVKEGFTKFLILIGLTEPQTETDKLIKKLTDKFVVSHAPGSAVMELEFTWDDADTAQKVLEKWISTYQEQRTINLGRKSLYDFYEKEIERLTTKIKEDKEKISKHLMSINGIGAGERINALTLEMDKMTHERDIAKAELAGMQSAYQTTTKNMDRVPEEIVRDRETSLNPARVDLNIRLNELEVKRLEKLKVFKPEAPPIKEIDASIAALKEKLNAESITLQRSQVVSPNELLSSMKKYSFDKSARVSELSSTVAQFDQMIAAKRAERDRIIQLEPELSELGRELSNSEKSLGLYAESLEKARIDKELDNNRISNIAIIQSASFVPTRVFPKSTLMIAASLPAAIAIALLVIYLCFLTDQRIHDSESIEERFDLPVWTTINDKHDPNSSQSAMLASIYRLYGMLPMDDIKTKGLTIGITSSSAGEGVSFVSNAFAHILNEYGIHCTIAEEASVKAKAGEVVIVEASNILSNANSLIALRDVDLCLLLVAAKQTKSATLERALSLLSTALRKVDGVIINKRRLELPNSVFNFLTSSSKV